MDQDGNLRVIDWGDVDVLRPSLDMDFIWSQMSIPANVFRGVSDLTEKPLDGNDRCVL